MKAYRYIRKSGIELKQSEPNAAVVVELYVDPDDRGKGVATRLMTAMCKEADREEVTLYLQAHPFGSYDIETETFYPPGLTFKQLCAFYRKFGFRMRPKPYENAMIRRPKKGK